MPTRNRGEPLEMDSADPLCRKSPVVDGKVERDANGKEVRKVMELTPQEKKIVRKIVHIFGQRVCGFDILRQRGFRG